MWSDAYLIHCGCAYAWITTKNVLHLSVTQFLAIWTKHQWVLDLGQKFTMCFFSGVECFGGGGTVGRQSKMNHKLWGVFFVS